MARNRDKYSKNRQLWRKFYGPRRRKPETTQYVDPITNISVSLDLHRTVRHRDYYIIKSYASGTISVSAALGFAEYDEGLLFFSNTTSTTGSFNFCFSNTPDAVCLTIEPTGDNTDFVVPYGLTFTSCSLSIGMSAPFSGSVRYRAVYSSEGYPAFASSSFVPASGTFRVFAGSISNNGAVTYNATYTGLGGVPTSVYKTPWDDFSIGDVDVNLSNEMIQGTNTTGHISAPLRSPIHYIAVR